MQKFFKFLHHSAHSIYAFLPGSSHQTLNSPSHVLSCGPIQFNVRKPTFQHQPARDDARKKWRDKICHLVTGAKRVDRNVNFVVPGTPVYSHPSKTDNCKVAPMNVIDLEVGVEATRVEDSRKHDFIKMSDADLHVSISEVHYYFLVKWHWNNWNSALRSV